MDHVNRVHGMSHTRIHNIWSKMIERCFDESNPAYKYYGGEGKYVCDEWCGEGGFIRFYQWSMENGYNDELSIERIDYKKGYSPDNCKWIPRNQQSWNTRTNIRVTYNGEEKTISQLANEYGLTRSKLYERLLWGWDIEEALGIKPHKKGDGKGFGKGIIAR